jgi:hypothetical protein
MKIFWIATALLAVECQAFAPSTGLATTTPRRLDSIRRRQLPKVIIQTSLYASLADDLTSESLKEDKGKGKKNNASSVPAGRRFDNPVPYEQLTIGVLKETFPGENRVSQTPDSVKNLVKAGFTVIVQSGGK